MDKSPAATQRMFAAFDEGETFLRRMAAAGLTHLTTTPMAFSIATLYIGMVPPLSHA